MNLKHWLKRLDLLTAVRKWPEASIISVFISIVLILIVRNSSQSTDLDLLLRIAISAYLAFLISIMIPLRISAQYEALATRLITAVAVILTYVLCFLWLPKGFTDSDYPYIQTTYTYFLLALLGHLGISCIAFIRSETSDDEFWRFNMTLLRNYIEGVFFVLIIMLCLSLALLALDHLFGMRITGEFYSYLFISLMGVFHPWFVLSHIPTVKGSEQSKSLSGFSILTVYILIPIVALYMLILYLYGGKILIQGSLPEGWLGKLSLGFCSIGVITFLFNSYLMPEKGANMSELYDKWFPKVLSIPVLLLGIAIWTRINDYGITENRYLVIALTIWLGFIALLYSIQPRTSIKWIPMSLLGFILFSILAIPVNIFNTSINSQTNRLELGLTEAGLLKNRKLTPISKDKADDSFIDLSILRYLENRIDLSGIEIWDNADIEWNEDAAGNQAEILRKYLGVGYMAPQAKEDEGIYYNNTSLGQIPISGYSNATHFEIHRTDKEDGYVRISPDGLQLLIGMNDSVSTITVHSLVERFQSLPKNNDNGSSPWTIEISKDKKLHFLNVSIGRQNGSYVIEACSGILLD